MKNTEALKSYFNNDLADDIRKLEAKRKSLIARLITMHTLILIALGVSVYVINLLFVELLWGWYTLTSLVFATIAAVIHFDIVNNKGFYTKFKTNIINKIVHFIHRDFHYHPHKFIHPSQFIDSQLFAHKPTKAYTGDDFVVGAIADEHFAVEFSELVAQFKDKKSGKTQALFKGLFFVAALENRFKGTTLILPSGSAGPYNRKGLPAVEVGSADFRKRFQVYSSNADEAQAILTADMQALILEFETEGIGHILISFVGDKINVAIEHTKDLFEPRIFHTLMDFSVLESYYFDLHESLEIVRKINRRSSSQSRLSDAQPAALA